MSGGGVSQRPQQHGATAHDPHRWRLVLTEHELATLRDALAAAGDQRGEALRLAIDQALERIDVEDPAAT